MFLGCTLCTQEQVIGHHENYASVMGVTITFIDKYNPRQFELVGFRMGDDGKDLSVNRKCPYFGVLIRNREPEK